MNRSAAWKKVLDRLDRHLKDRGLSRRQVSLDAGLSESFVKDLYNKGNVPSVDNFAALCRSAETTVEAMLFGDRPGPVTVPIIGCAAAGGGWTPYDDGEIGEINMDLSGAIPVAIEVKGDSMAPVYRDGDILIGARMEGASIERASGKDCICVTADGNRAIKFISKERGKKTYTLRSYNPAHAPIEGIRLVWAAPIMWVRRR